MTRTDRVFAAVGLLATIFLVITINLTTPSDIGPLGVLVFFTLVYLVCLGVIVGLCRIFFAVRGKMQKNKTRVSPRKSYYYATVLAFVPMILIFMRSLGGLNLLEIALVVLFAVVGCFYISKKA